MSFHPRQTRNALILLLEILNLRQIFCLLRNILFGAIYFFKLEFNLLDYIAGNRNLADNKLVMLI